MAADVYRDLREQLRRATRDAFAVQWTDAALNAIIDEAQREYSIYAGTLIGKQSFAATKDGVFFAPDDFFEPVAFFDDKNRELPIYSWRKLNELYADFRKITGIFPQCVCFDFDGWKKFRVFPQIPEGTFAGTLHYRRLARRGVLEVANTDAVKSHCLYQMALFAGKQSAQSYFADFTDSVNNEARSDQTLRNRRTNRGGVFF